MKEQKISFETAKLAKEKGLNKVWCNNMYCIGFNELPEDEEIIECDWRDNVDGQFHLALAPTQALLQKWLREKYKLHIRVVELSLYMWSFMIIELSVDGTQGKGGHLGKKNYKSYEEALEAGLKEGLKLIKM